MSKKQIIQVHTCFQCQFAYLMRSTSYNPVVAECAITHGREIASTPLRCRHFKQRIGDAAINPMKFLKQYEKNNY